MISSTPPSLREFAPGLLGEAVASALKEQATLTAVDKFSSWHSETAPGNLENWYRELLPLAAPGPGEQYAFEVNLDRCSGCKACVTACHNLNGLDDDEGESFRDVGLLLDPAAMKGPQHITTACHHCQEPLCAEGCPVLAYEKQPDTGVVKHLDDQCIGCEYCVLKCPYDVPKFHHGKGIVRKCDLCVDRLRVGEAPACVQACPTKAIKVTVITLTPKSEQPAAGFSMPGAPDPKHSRPTTRFVSSQPLPKALRAADFGKLKPEAAHGPLAALLVISQAAFGLAWAGLAWKYFLDHRVESSPWLLPLLSALAMNAAMLVGLTHLGRPQLAWKAWMNWRKSWFSREVIVFGAFAGVSGAAAAFGLIGEGGPWHDFAASFPLPRSLSPAYFSAWLGGFPSLLLDAAVGLVGLAAVGASAMIYIDTPRAMWHRGATALRFVLTALATGPALAAAVLIALGHRQGVGALLLLAGCAHAAKWMVEASLLRHLRVSQNQANEEDRVALLMTRSAQLLAGPQGGIALLRTLLGVVALALTGWLSWTNSAGLGIAQLAALNALLYFAADFLERHLFFTTAAAPRMPGAF